MGVSKFGEEVFAMRRILIVDDDAAYLRSLRRRLSATGLVVQAAGCGVEALEHAHQNDFDLVVTDLQMPGVDGYTLAQRLRSIHPETPFVLMSGAPDMQAVKGEWFAKLQKPFSDEVLRTTLQQALIAQNNLLPFYRSQLRALVVEDQPADACLLTTLLRSTKYSDIEVEQYETVADAVARLEHEAFDIILSDLSLLDLSGAAVVQQLRSSAPNTPVIVVSETGDKKRAAEFLRIGAQDFLFKSELTSSGMERAIRFALARGRTERRLSSMAHTDPLTGLNNRRRLLAQLHELLHRQKHQRHALLFFDLDGFKAINDNLGHEAGDQLLREAARRIRESLRSSHDLAGRLGGDEFAVLLRDIEGERDAFQIATRSRLALSEPIEIGGHSVAVRATVGVALYPNHATEGPELVRCADAAMYHGKKLGRNIVSVYRASHAVTKRSKPSLHSRLAHALRTQAFDVVYQPQIDLDTRQVYAVEALVRWPDEPTVSVRSIIHGLEQMGHIRELGELVLNRSCGQLRKWRAQGYAMKLAVNLSPAEFGERNLVARILRVVAVHDLRNEDLILELPESGISQDFRRARNIGSELASAGVHLCVDDFGTGYTCLGHLDQLSLSAVKLDRTFVKQLPTSLRATAVVDAVVGIARAFQLRVMAKGVENEAQLRFLRDRGCQFIQGFHCASPMTPDRLDDWLRRQQSRPSDISALDPGGYDEANLRSSAS